MDEALEFCLLKFAEDQRILHDDERRVREEIYQSQLDEIKIKEEKILFEQKIMAEQIEKKLTLYKQQKYGLKAQLECEIKRQLWQHYDSKTQSMEDIISAKKTEYHKWIEEKQQEKSNIFNENELMKFNQTFIIEDEYKKKYLQDLSETTRKQLEIEKGSLDYNVQAILQIITSSSDEKEWLTNVKGWFDKKFQSEKVNENLNSQLMTTENKNTPSQYFLSDKSIKRISSTMSDTNTSKQELIIEFKQKVEEIFQNELIESRKYTDKQIQRLKSLSFDKAAEAGRIDDPLHMAMLSVSNAAMSLNSTIASSELCKRDYFAKLRQEYDDIISELESTDIDQIPNRIEKWLKKHRDERMTCFKKLYQEHEEKQSQCLANDQSQMIKLSCCLNELAINSESAYKLREKLKDDEELMLKKHRELKLSQTKITVPVIVRQIDDPKVHKLSVCIRFDEDFDQWMKNAEKNKLELTRSIEKQFDLPEKAFEIIAIEKGSIVCFANIHPPHGEQVYQRLMTNGISNIGGRDTVSVTLGDLNLNVEQEKMNRRYNRSYGSLVGDTHWIGSLPRGGRPYFCPKGWRRFGIKVTETPEEFDHRWGDWHIAYHGTASENAVAILQTGLKTNAGCFSKVQKVVYLSPSINYSAHYRYATPWKNPQQPGKYYQMIFQCRVNPLIMTPDKIKPQTLRCPPTVCIDEHFGNNEVEWLIYPETNGATHIKDNIICYGIMIRVVDGDPYDLPESTWWHDTPYPRKYLNE